VRSLSDQFKVFFDEQKCLDEIRGHYEWCLGKLGDIFLSQMQSEVLKTVDGKTPGKAEWREATRAKLKVVSKEITDKFISVKVGLDENALLYEFVRAMLIDSGSGDKAGGEPIRKKPGEIVWDDDLKDQRESKATENKSLPPGFNQSGNEFISNAMRKMNTYAPRYVKALNRRILESIKSNIYFIDAKG